MGKFFKKFEERTPYERVRMEKNRIVLRLVCCGYVIYLGINVMQKANEEAGGGMTPATAYIVGALLIAASVGLLVLTGIQYMRSKKLNEFDRLTYYRQKYGPDFTEEDMIRYEETGKLPGDPDDEPAESADAADTDTQEALPDAGETNDDGEFEQPEEFGDDESGDEVE